ncbi:MAG: hypothetical protein LUD72_02650 [Bacteroidales bacterium]|nr:hypothetical protein [Bacteroidales bacterium]
MDKDKQLAPQKNEITKWQEAYIEEFESPKTILVSEDEWNKVHEEVRRLENELKEAQKDLQTERDEHANQLKTAVRKLEKAEKPTYRIRIEVKYNRGDYVNLEEYQFTDRDFEVSPNVLKEIKEYIAIVEVGVHRRLMELRDEIAYDIIKEITERCENYLRSHVSYTTAGFGPFKERFENTDLADKVSKTLHFAINLEALGINPSPDFKVRSLPYWDHWRSNREPTLPNAWGLESHRHLDWEMVERRIDVLNRKYGEQ